MRGVEGAEGVRVDIGFLECNDVVLDLGEYTLCDIQTKVTVMMENSEV